MKADRLTIALLGMVAVLLFLNLLSPLMFSKSALATTEGEQKGRYQIAAWGGQAQNNDPRSGYYVLDTVTGMVVASKTEIHRMVTGEGK